MVSYRLSIVLKLYKKNLRTLSTKNYFEYYRLLTFTVTQKTIQSKSVITSCKGQFKVGVEFAFLSLFIQTTNLVPIFQKSDRGPCMLTSYVTGSHCIFLRHLGFLDLPITNSFFTEFSLI